MKENKNEPEYTGNEDAYPCKHVYADGDVSYRSGLTKLELISAMCLQGILSNEILVGSWTLERSSEVAIENAKELLKQLEAEND